LSNEKIISCGADIFITTDDPDFFNDISLKSPAKLVTFSFTPEPRMPDVREGSKRTWFNYHQKRIAIKNAHKSGYNKIFYIDSDIRVFDWKEERLIKEESGFWFRTLLSRNQYLNKYKFYDTLYNVDKWHYYRPVSEKIIYINECSDKITGFLKVWEHLEMISRGKVNPYSEGHEILISARFNGARISKYKPDPFKGDNKIMEDAHI